MLKTKSVHDPIEKSDRLRILTSRFRGRGMKADRYDLWMPSLGPSERLLRSMLNGEINCSAFVKRYREEVLASSDLDAKNRTVLNHGQRFTLRLIKKISEGTDVTFMCHCVINQLSQNNAARAEDITGHAKDIAAMAKDLKQQIASFHGGEAPSPVDAV